MGIWVPDAALVAVSEVVTTGVTTVVGSDVAAVLGGSGCKRWGWRLCSGAVDRFRSECHRFRGSAGCFEAGEEVVVVVANDIDSADSGCVGVISDDVVDRSGVDWLLVVLLGTVGEPEGSERCGGVVVPYFDVFAVSEVVGRRLV